MSDLQPNEEGTVCCVCRKPIVPHVDVIHGAYFGVEARHYECTATANIKTAFDEFDRAHRRAKATLNELRRKLKEPRRD